MHNRWKMVVMLGPLSPTPLSFIQQRLPFLQIWVVFCVAYKHFSCQRQFVKQLLTLVRWCILDHVTTWFSSFISNYNFLNKSNTAVSQENLSCCLLITHYSFSCTALCRLKHDSINSHGSLVGQYPVCPRMVYDGCSWLVSTLGKSKVGPSIGQILLLTMTRWLNIMVSRRDLQFNMGS